MSQLEVKGLGDVRGQGSQRCQRSRMGASYNSGLMYVPKMGYFPPFLSVFVLKIRAVRTLFN